jgi:hypothetical protein
MKMLLAILTLASTSLWAQSWTETYKLPEGTTYRARMTGYDCGTFGSTYVEAPVAFTQNQVEFKQLSADKDINKFLIEAAYPGAEGQSCIYGVFLDRDRATKTFKFGHSIVTTDEGMAEGCQPTKAFIDSHFQDVAYEASKRGIRYIAVEVVKDGAREVCESGVFRAIFDRRF